MFIRLNRSFSISFVTLVAILLVSLQFEAKAAEVTYQLEWAGVNGYTASGSFSYNETGAPAIIDESHLTAFNLTLYDPTGATVTTFDLTNQGPNFFNFNFDAQNRVVLQQAGASASGPTGFRVGAWGNTNYIYSTFLGCGSYYRDSNNDPISGITFIYGETGGCNGQLLDYGGTLSVVDPNQSSDIDGDGIADTSDPCPSDPSNNCNVNGSAAEEITSIEGGEITTPNGQLTLVVDADDLAEDETLSVTQIADEQVPPNVVVSDGSGDPLAMYVFEPDGTQFDQPISLTINLDVTSLSPESRENLDIYLSVDSDGDDVPDSFMAQHATCIVTEDPADIFTASCNLELDHFSTYAVIAPKDTDGDGIFDDFGGIEDGCPSDDSTGFDADGDGCIDDIEGLTELVAGLLASEVIDSNMENSLLSKLANVQKSQEKDNICAMVDQLTSFNSQVAAQTGKKISAGAATEVTSYANSLMAFVSLALPEGESCE